MKIKKAMAAPGMTANENKIKQANVMIRVVGDRSDTTFSLEADGREILVPFMYVQAMVDEAKKEIMMCYALRTGGKK